MSADMSEHKQNLENYCNYMSFVRYFREKLDDSQKHHMDTVIVPVIQKMFHIDPSHSSAILLPHHYSMCAVEKWLTHALINNKEIWGKQFGGVCKDYVYNLFEEFDDSRMVYCQQDFWELLESELYPHKIEDIWIQKKFSTLKARGVRLPEADVLIDRDRSKEDLPFTQ